MEKLASQKVGKDFEFKVVASLEKNGIVDWAAILLKKGAVIAEFHKGAIKKKYLVNILKQPFELNLNGVKATYLEWRSQLERQFNLKPIKWEPQTREFYRYKIGGGA